MALRLPDPRFFAPASIGGSYGQAVNVYRGLTAGQLANAQLRETLARQQAMEDLYGGLDEAYKKQKEVEELNKRLGMLEKAADDYEKGLISEGALRQVYDEHVAPFTGIGFEQFVEAPKNFQQSAKTIADIYGVQEGTPAYSALVQRGGVREEVKRYLRETRTPAYKVGQTREVKVGNKVITQEWTGREWKNIGEAPRFKPAGSGAGGKGSGIGTKFSTYISQLNNLYKARSSIKKGVNPYTGNLIPQENIKKALDDINLQIRRLEGYLEYAYPEQFKVYKQSGMFDPNDPMGVRALIEQMRRGR